MEKNNEEIISQPVKPRIEWVDVAKGIGIFLVVLGHCIVPNYFRMIIFAFHMPLFFFLSGLFVLKNESLSFRQFLLIKSKQLLVPLYVFSVLLSICAYSFAFAMHQDFNWINRCIGWIFQFKDGKYYGSLWFLSCLFVMSILIRCLKKIMVSKMWLVCVILSLIGSVYVEYVGVSLPWQMELAFVNILFLCLGSIIAVHKDMMKYTHLRLVIAILIFVISASLNYSLFGSQVDECGGRLGIIPLFYLGALSGIYVTVLISHKITCRWLMWLGRNSLLYYCLHFLLKVPLNKIFDILFKDLETWQIISLGIVKTLIIVLILVPVVQLINKRFAWVLGRF